jgi:hypothetical protein
MGRAACHSTLLKRRKSGTARSLHCQFSFESVFMGKPMSASEESNDQRAKQAEKIASHPEQYKVCEGCGSIVVTRAVTCPSCHAYRFDATPVRVVSQARELALRAAHSVLSSDLS